MASGGVPCQMGICAWPAGGCQGFWASRAEEARRNRASAVGFGTVETEYNVNGSPFHKDGIIEPLMRKVTALLLALFVGRHCYADDGASSIAAGGVVVLAKEPRITMAREKLEISADKIRVEYEFRNDSDADVTTLVAFPIPDYVLSMEQIEPGWQGFDDFVLSVNGERVPFQTQSRALVKGRDVTEILGKLQIDVASFGHAKSNDESPQIHRLSRTGHLRLEKLGIIDSGSDGALWTVKKKYFWTQTFPAHKPTVIRHEYRPVLGSTNSIRYALGDDPDKASVKEVQSMCVDGPLREALKGAAKAPRDYSSYSYVDFILTSANTWKQPIEDFTLIITRPKSSASQRTFVSFCWDGPVRKPDADHFEARATKFVPHKELRIGFFTLGR